jgi:HTH-type transcriptional regulator/antitoxin HipB
MDALLLQSPSQLSLHLKSLRKARNLTQAQVAKRLRIGQARYAQMELNPAAISTGRLLEIFATLGVDVLLRLRQENARTPTKQGEDW